MLSLRTAWLAFLAAGTLAIAAASLSYVTEGELHPFILEKEPLPSLYLAALYVHVPAAIISLAACLVLVSRRLMRAHRWLGRVTGVVVLFALIPSGTWLAFFAKGGLPGTLGFLLSGVISGVAMVIGARAAMKRDFTAHRRAMLHVLAQLSVAVTSRALIVGLDAAGLDEDTAYLTALWGPVVFSALFVERIAARSRRPHADHLDALVLDPVR